MDDIGFIFVLLIASDSRTEKCTKGRWGDSGQSVRAGGSPAMLPVH